MKLIGQGLFTGGDRLQMQALEHRLKRSQVITANIANAETPGYRALGYAFEDQLQAVAGIADEMRLATSTPGHFVHSFANANGEITPDVYIRPTESVGQDGNTVDIDQEMARMAENQILYRASVEMLNRKIGVLRYAINGGR